MIIRRLYILLLLFPCWSQAIQRPVNLLRACPSGNHVLLSWEIFPDACGSFQAYYIYGSPTGLAPFLLLDSVKLLNQSSYTHLNALPNDKWKYYVVTRFLCDGNPSGPSDTLGVDILANPPTLDSVSVDINTRQIQIGWSGSPDPDILKYDIRQLKTSGNTLIGETSSTQFLANGPYSPDSSFGFRISAEDSCGNTSILVNAHQTMQLKHDYDSCRKSAKLNWTPYIGWAGIERYDIYLSINAAPFVYVGSSNGSNPSFLYQGVNPGDSLRFFVRAFRLGGGASSSSNASGFRTRFRALPSYCYLRCLDVIADDKINLSWVTDPNAEVSKFKIFRSNDGAAFSELQQIDFDPISTYTDAGLRCKSQIYYYQILCYDVCDSVIFRSNIARSILLRSTPVENSGAHLEWNSYEGFLSSVGEYKIFLGQGNGSGTQWKGRASTLELSYDDPNSITEIGEENEICYQVLAFEKEQNSLGYKDSCRSNISCSAPPIIAYFPNAFAPTGFNNVFKPVCSFIDLGTSFMTIYDRWGGIVKKVSIKNGWDGKGKSNEIEPEGTYFYVANLYGINGVSRVFSGSVYLFNSE